MLSPISCKKLKQKFNLEGLFPGSLLIDSKNNGSISSGQKDYTGYKLKKQ